MRRRKGVVLGGVSALLATGLAVGILREPVEITPTPVESSCDDTFIPGQVNVADAFVRSKILAEDQTLQRTACRYAEAIGSALSQSQDPTFSWSVPDRTGGELELEATHKDALGSTVVRASFSAPNSHEGRAIKHAEVGRTSPTGEFMETIGLYRSYSPDDNREGWIIQHDKPKDPNGSWISDSITSSIYTIEDLDSLQAKVDQAVNTLAAVRLPAH